MDEIWDLIVSVYEGFPTYFCLNRVLISLFLSTSKEITSKNFFGGILSVCSKTFMICSRGYDC